MKQIPFRFFAWLGHCGFAVWRLFLRGILLLLTAVLRLLGDLLRLFGSLLKEIGAQIRDFVQSRTETAAAVRTEMQDPDTGKAKSIFRSAGLLLLSQNGVLRTLIRFAVPVTCCMLLWTVIQRGVNQNYAVAVTVNGKTLGMIANEQDYLNAQETVYRRLSYTEEDTQFSFSRTLELQACPEHTVLLTSGELADEILRNANIELTDGYGVYVNDAFQGAVDDPHLIEAALTRQLSAVSNALKGTAEEVYFADKVTYEKGSFLAENIIDANDLANRLTHTEHSVRTYTAGECDSVYTVAERFSVTPDEIRKLNPKLTEDAIPNGFRTKVPIVQRFLPIVYTKKVNTVSFIDYDTKEIETSELREGETDVLKPGVKGEKEQKVLVTYTDGMETSRKILSSRLVQRPVTEEIGIGTYAAAPYSKDTIIDGSGKFAWPVDGGWISAPFGGENGHWGIDIAAAAYTDIYAAESGKVRIAGWNDSYGFYVVIDHGDGYETLYAHCIELLVHPEEEVRRGQLIALVGTTGNSTGFHTHFEVRHNGLHEDPKLFLRVNTNDEESDNS